MRVDRPSEVVFATGRELCPPTRIGAKEKSADDAECESDRPAATHLNDALLAQLDLPKMESFWFTAADGTKLEGFLIRPPGFDAAKKYPVKFLIHGGPQGNWGDDWSYRWNAELFAANGYVVVMINMRGSTGYGQAIVDGVNGDWGGKPFTDLMEGLDYAEQHYPFIDKDRECALGASYGGYMANWVLGHTDRFKCIVSHDGMFNAESAFGTTEEDWFNIWEFKGHPWDYYGKPDDQNPLPQVVAVALRQELQDADAGDSRPARLPARRERGVPALRHAATARRAEQDALLPRRGPLGAEAAELAALVQDGERLGGRVDKGREQGLGNREQKARWPLRENPRRRRTRSTKQASTTTPSRPSAGTCALRPSCAG